MHIATIINNIDTFNSDLFNYDYEELEREDIIERLDYTFNESYLNRENIRINQQIQELENEKIEIQSELDRISDIKNLDIDKVRNLLNEYFVRE